jgi:hypothetical protein
MPRLALLLAVLAAAPVRAGFLNLTDLTPGGSGTAVGELDGIGVTIAITTEGANFQFSPAVGGDSFARSHLDGTSVQYSYGNIYSPSQALGDQLGYTSVGQSDTTAIVRITFDSAVLNPVFHVANVDLLQFDFTPTAGLAGLSLLSGNGDGSEGLMVVGNVIRDANPSGAAWEPTDPPPTTGSRSAYGSVQILGTFTELTINVIKPNNSGADGGSFTLSTSPPATTGVPEPSTLALLAAGAISALAYGRLRRK